MRQVVLDTETTGLAADQGHRIIEIGCIEIVNRRLSGHTLHVYLNPEREIDEASDIAAVRAGYISVTPLYLDLTHEAMRRKLVAEFAAENEE